MGFLLLIKSVQIFATKNITQVSGTEKEKRKKQAGGRRKKKEVVTHSINKRLT